MEDRKSSEASKRGGVQEVYVKWSGFPKKFSSWIKESDLQDV